MRQWTVIGLSLLASCGEASRAHESVTQLLNNPASVDFRNDEVNKNGVVCGEVNVGNRMGGRAGFTPYIYINPIMVEISSGPPDLVEYYMDEENLAAFDKVTSACSFVDDTEQYCSLQRAKTVERFTSMCKLWLSSAFSAQSASHPAAAK